MGGGLYVAVIGEAGDAGTAERDLHRSITLIKAADYTEPGAEQQHGGDGQKRAILVNELRSIGKHPVEKTE